jgi:hypothetical protein
MRSVIRKSLRKRLQERWQTGIPICPAPHSNRPRGSTLYFNNRLIDPTTYDFTEDRFKHQTIKPGCQTVIHPPRRYTPTAIMLNNGWVMSQERDEGGRLK